MRGLIPLYLEFLGVARVGGAVWGVLASCTMSPRLEAALSNVEGNIVRQEVAKEHNSAFCVYGG